MSDKKELFSIGKAAEKAGISRQSLQYYLMLDLMSPTERTSTGRRKFDDQAVERIKLIKKLNESGYPLRAIRDLFLQDKPAPKGTTDD